MNDKFKTLQIIWAALMMGVFTYSVVACVIIFTSGIAFDAVPVGALNYVVPAAALGMIGGSVLRRRLVDAVPRDLAPEPRMERYAAAAITGLALIEAFGLLAITVSMIAGSATWVAVSGMLGIGTMALNGPSREEAGLGR